MNALIFAAGLGTRLKPLTDTMPKALVPVNGKPLVQILIERLKCIGVTEVVINVHHFAQQIIDYVEDNDSFGINIHFSDETSMLLETGGGLKKASRLFSNDEPILVHNVDILSNADLQALYAQPATTLLVSARHTQRYLLFSHTNRLVGWVNIATGQVKSPFPEIKALDCEGHPDLLPLNRENLTVSLDSLPSTHFPQPSTLHLYAFSGIQVFHPSLLPLMDAWEGKFSIIDFYLSICNQVAIYALPDARLHLLDVGKLDTIAKAEAFVENENW
ncbi:MAG: NTP transferase domain-containing protein [Bacteroidales bacterium]|nr:NTP transferase domain-containing protein [Bacteroidales bacterium]